MMSVLKQYAATIVGSLFFIVGLSFATNGGVSNLEAGFLLITGLGTLLTLMKKFTIAGLAMATAGLVGLLGIVEPAMLAILLILFVPLIVVMR